MKSFKNIEFNNTAKAQISEMLFQLQLIQNQIGTKALTNKASAVINKALYLIVDNVKTDGMNFDNNAQEQITEVIGQLQLIKNQEAVDLTSKVLHVVADNITRIAQIVEEALDKKEVIEIEHEDTEVSCGPNYDELGEELAKLTFNNLRKSYKKEINDLFAKYTDPNSHERIIAHVVDKTTNVSIIQNVVSKVTAGDRIEILNNVLADAKFSADNIKDYDKSIKVLLEHNLSQNLMTRTSVEKLIVIKNEVLTQKQNDKSENSNNESSTAAKSASKVDVLSLNQDVDFKVEVAGRNLDYNLDMFLDF